MNYFDIVVANEIYQERIKNYNGQERHFLYTPELPSFGVVLSGFGKKVQSLLASAVAVIVTNQGLRAPIGRRLASKRN